MFCLVAWRLRMTQDAGDRRAIPGQLATQVPHQNPPPLSYLTQKNYNTPLALTTDHWKPRVPKVERLGEFTACWRRMYKLAAAVPAAEWRTPIASKVNKEGEPISKTVYSSRHNVHPIALLVQLRD